MVLKEGMCEEMDVFRTIFNKWPKLCKVKKMAVYRGVNWAGISMDGPAPPATVINSVRLCIVMGWPGTARQKGLGWVSCLRPAVQSRPRSVKTQARKGPGMAQACEGLGRAQARGLKF